MTQNVEASTFHMTLVPSLNIAHANHLEYDCGHFISGGVARAYIKNLQQAYLDEQVDETTIFYSLNGPQINFQYNFTIIMHVQNTCKRNVFMMTPKKKCIDLKWWYYTSRS